MQFEVISEEAKVAASLHRETATLNYSIGLPLAHHAFTPPYDNTAYQLREQKSNKLQTKFRPLKSEPFSLFQRRKF